MILNNNKKQHYALFKSHIARTPGVFPPPDAVAAVIFTYKVFGHKNSCLVEQRLLSRYMILNGAKVGINFGTAKGNAKKLRYLD